MRRCKARLCFRLLFAANRLSMRKWGVWPFWNAPPLSSLLYLRPGTNPRLPRDVVCGGKENDGESTLIGRGYLVRQAATLLKFAQTTTDPKVAAGLVEKAADLRSQVDEASALPDLSS